MPGPSDRPPPLPPDPADPPRGIRDTLFGDAPLDQWPPAGSSAEALEPWATFARARRAVAAGREAEAVDLWRAVTGTPGLESRHYLQAWHFLRAGGVHPPADRAKELLGVVVEVPMNDGLDLLAAYPERTARYYNYTGAGAVWERPDDSLDAPIEALLAAGRPIVAAIGPWDQPRPPAPPPGQMRLNFLTPSGLHFGQAPFQALASDPFAKPAVDAAVALLQRLVELGERGRGGRPPA